MPIGHHILQLSTIHMQQCFYGDDCSMVVAPVAGSKVLVVALRLGPQLLSGLGGKRATRFLGPRSACRDEGGQRATRSDEVYETIDELNNP